MSLSILAGHGGGAQPRRILLYGINFAPEPTGVGKYTGEMAAWLAQAGHEVRVIAAPPYSRATLVSLSQNRAAGSLVGCSRRTPLL